MKLSENLIGYAEQKTS